MLRPVVDAIGDLRSRLGGRRRETPLASFYERFVSAGGLVFDVGANTGERVGAFRRLGARVVAVEPQPACLALLQRRFGSDALVEIVPKGLAAEEGRAKLHLNELGVLASMSSSWIEATERSGRFRPSGSRWTEVLEVPTTTLDYLVEVHGTPDFCKLDVEGFESEVLRGLSKPLRAVSFEFAGEALENALECVERLSSLGARDFNVSSAESLEFEGEWVGPREVASRLSALDDPKAWGDVYARFPHQ